ncbi:MAG: phytanoyl-CoA dioxygenase family protein [Sphingopyxis sp.]|uniref:phytanoyl-CoA dioxygenase family protein n=1 Tax=Sphingopyxis sp. TaxID=1908224 RepID=UPI003D81119E
MRDDRQNRQAAFAADGVVHIPAALSPAHVAAAERAFEWSIANPGPHAGAVLAGAAGAFFQDHANPAALPHYRDFAVDGGLAALIADVLGTQSLWLLYEQVWRKAGGATRRTPWHQDLAYVPMAGDHMATAWICLDPVAADMSLEFVPGSHRGPLYNPTAFSAVDEAAAMFADGIWPPLPPIEAERSRFPIVRWAVAPGDVILFHPAVLHGGAPTLAGQQRRTISLRVFGDDVTCSPRPDQGIAEIDRLAADDPDGDPIRFLAGKPEGTPFRHPAFAKLL